MDVFRIGKRNLIVVPGIPGVRKDVSSTGAGCLDGMRLERPVADVDLDGWLARR